MNFLCRLAVFTWKSIIQLGSEKNESYWTYWAILKQNIYSDQQQQNF